MESPFTSFESVRASLLPETVRSTGPVRGPGEGPRDAPRTAMVLRLENATLAEALTLVPGLRASVAVTVAGTGTGRSDGSAVAGETQRETFLFHRGCLIGSTEALRRLRALLEEGAPVVVVMKTAEEMAGLFEDVVSVMEILLEPGEGWRSVREGT